MTTILPIKKVIITAKPKTKKPVLPTSASGQVAVAYSVPRSIGSIMPSEFKTTLRYVEYKSLDPGAGAFARHAWNPSGLYDPDITGAGHQPLGFDQIAAFYAHYLVEACDIVVKIHPSAVGAIPVAVGVFNTHDNDHNGPWQEVVEQQQNVVYKVFNGATNVPVPNAMTLSLRYDAKKMTGLTIGELKTSDLSASVAANPVDGFTTLIWAQACDLSADPAAIYYVIELTYHALFFTKKSLDQS